MTYLQSPVTKNFMILHNVHVLGKNNLFEYYNSEW